MVNNNNEKIYIGQTRRFIIEQTIGFNKVLDCLEKKFNVKALRNHDHTIILVEEKEKEPEEKG